MLDTRLYIVILNPDGTASTILLLLWISLGGLGLSSTTP